jgi:hypothetical protein
MFLEISDGVVYVSLRPTFFLLWEKEIGSSQLAYVIGTSPNTPVSLVN